MRSLRTEESGRSRGRQAWRGAAGGKPQRRAERGLLASRSIRDAGLMGGGGTSDVSPGWEGLERLRESQSVFQLQV